MSEPASLVVQCAITPDGLRQCLAAREPRTSECGDWDRLGIALAPDDVAQIDLQTGTTTGDFLRNMRRYSERPADWLFAYDAQSQLLTFGQALFSENWTTIVAVLGVLRRLGNFTEPQQGCGIILVHDWIYHHRGTMAAISLGSGGSMILEPADIPQNAEHFVASILSPQRNAAIQNRPRPIHDDLDEWLGSH